MPANNILPLELSSQFPQKHFAGSLSYHLFEQLYHLGNTSILQPISPGLTKSHRKISQRGVIHYITPVHPDFKEYWTGVGSERAREVEKETGTLVKFADGAHHSEAFMAITGTHGANREAQRTLTTEYLKTPTETYHNITYANEPIQSEFRIPRSMFTFGIGRLGRGIGEYRQIESCSVTVDKEPIQDEYTFKVRGPKETVQRIEREVTDRVQHALSRAKALQVKQEDEKQQRIQHEKQPKKSQEKQQHLMQNQSQDNTQKSGGDHQNNPRNRSEQMRRLMRLMPHSVVLVTAANLDAISLTSLVSKDNFCAMTISSMTTVSLNPEPIISFNIKKPSRTLDTIMSEKLFYTTILASTEEGAFIADAFSRGDAQAAFKKIEDHGASVQLRPQDSRLAPVIASRGIVGNFACEPLPKKCVEVADHVIIVAKVRHLSMRSSPQQILGLTYTDGCYRRPSQPFPPSAETQVTLEEPNQSNARNEKPEKVCCSFSSLGRLLAEANSCQEDKAGSLNEDRHSENDLPMGQRRATFRIRKFKVSSQHGEAQNLSSSSQQNDPADLADPAKNLTDTSSQNDLEVSSQTPETSDVAEEEDFETNVPLEARYNFPGSEFGIEENTQDRGSNTLSQGPEKQTNISNHEPIHHEQIGETHGLEEDPLQMRRRFWRPIKRG